MSFEFTEVTDITFISKDAAATSRFYETVGLPKLDVAELDVFRLGDKELAIRPELADDYPFENPNTVYVSVLVNDLRGLCDHLDHEGIGYIGPKPSHLGTDSIHLTDPDGNHLEIHQDAEGAESITPPTSLEGGLQE